MAEAHELSVSHHIAAPPAVVWRAFTEHLTEWWCPRPWTSEIRALEWRPGGAFDIAMKGPDGEGGGGAGVVLEVTPERRFVFTSALAPGWQPQEDFKMVGIFEFAPAADGGTDYRATARHWDEATKQTHEAMGFATGWGAVAVQLAEVAERLDAR
ncbi:SRPBCC domain-containing protein [Sandarakinorhabdus sp. DWP1-3-1]|uniref:SRPBCC domain-containing protein n=1 Tax=Sandarakinorhabdus sp. DWP1-3-1 TaxID=2804627 RepID=UPI003CF85E32